MELFETNDLVKKYLHFYEVTQSTSSIDDEIRDIRTLLDVTLKYSPSAFFIINYQKMEFEYFSPRFKDFLGADWENYIKFGPKYTVANMTSSHINTFINHTLPEIKRQLSLIPMDERINYQFTYNFYSSANYRLFNFRQENRYVKSMPDGTPLLAFANGYDITGLLPNNLVRLSIHKISVDKFELIFEKDFYTENTENDIFTIQENKLIELAKNGLDTNQMAQAMFLSPETIKKHRKNIVKKAGVKNMYELLLKHKSN
ncbi:MAG: helix-turn-helix transcriptional regulator [Cytophagales bacterium]|nr:helix-turn-helix transcriptional regulator [Cytophagales bacterium]